MPTICPRCEKAVYFAEETKALGKTWHKLCLACASCKKVLDSYSVTGHQGEAYCKNCYGKNFGPTGYGFAGGAAGLAGDRRTSNGMKEYIPSNDQSSNKVINGCPRCGKAVYFAEERIAHGKKWHKLCLKCANCNKLLDSTIMTEHGDEIYCKACYGKLFGPKGYGFAGGSSGLSMDTGKANFITTKNVSHYGLAQAAPLLDNGQPPCENGCPVCGKAVYFAEQTFANNQLYHKSCLKCKLCSRLLDSTTLTSNEKNIYCKSCYAKNFGPKGFGFGNATMHT